MTRVGLKTHIPGKFDYHSVNSVVLYLNGSPRRFTVEWLWRREVSFDYLGHIPVKTNPSYLMKSCYSGAEMSQASGLEALTIFSARG